MGGFGSGGSNRKPVEAHLLRGTFRPSRHADRAEGADAALVSPADRRRTLQGLTGEARRLAVALLEEYAGWSPETLVTLRAYVQSAARLEALQQRADPNERRLLFAEARHMVTLLKALRLEVER